MSDLLTQLPSIIRGELLKYLGKSEPTLDKVTIFKDRSKFCNAFLGKNRIFFLAVPCVTKIKELFAEEVSGEHIR